MIALAAMGGVAAFEIAANLALAGTLLGRLYLIAVPASGMIAIVAAYLELRGRSKFAKQAVQQEPHLKRIEAELDRAKAAAEAARRAQREFFAGTSHELRAPLNGILGMTELALHTELTTDQRDCLEMIKTSADALLIVLNAILEYSQLETETLELEQVKFDLRENVGEAAQALALWAYQRNLELACHIRSDVPSHVIGDPIRLRQIVLNLVGDVISLTEDGELLLEVESGHKTEDRLAVHFTLTSTGIPIEKQRIVLRSTAEGQRLSDRASFGVGVSVRLVQLMGGRLWADDEDGKRMRFHFTAQFGVPEDSSTMALPEAALKLRELAALVVDDSATNRRILCDMLLQWQMKPTTAEGGARALALLEHAGAAGKPFPLMILDASLPDMDGFALVQRIKQNARFTGATVMMLGPSDEHASARRCRESGVTAHVFKPVKQSDLLQSLFVAIKKSEQKVQHVAETPRKFCVLLAEDNLVNQKLVVRWLEKRGHAVVVVDNGREAVAVLENSLPARFDLVLMDVQMPEMDGFEATAAIRRMEKASGAHLPILALTAHAMKGDRERCLAAGMDGYISKPVRAKALIEAVEKWAARSDQTSALPQQEEEEMLDWSGAPARVDTSRRPLADTTRLFRLESRRLLAAMHQAIARQDAKALEDATEALGSLKDWAATPSSFDFAERSKQIPPEGGLSAPDTDYLGLEEEFERVRQALAALGKGATH